MLIFVVDEVIVEKIVVYITKSILFYDDQVD